MLIPAIHGLAIGDFRSARSFFYPALLFLVLFSFVAVATSNYAIRRQGRSHLIALAATFTILPAMLAVLPRAALSRRTTRGGGLTSLFARLTENHGAAVFVVSGLVLVIGAAGIARLEVDTLLKMKLPSL